MNINLALMRCLPLMLAVAIAAIFPAAAAEKNKVHKKIEEPVLIGPITHDFVLGKKKEPKPTIDPIPVPIYGPAVGESAENETPPKSAKDRNEAKPASSEPQSPVDLAYGAYQRGYYLTALDLALPRAESGNPAAQTLIAEIYERGLGVGQDRKKAANWYRFAAAAGNREAQFAFANMLIAGKVVPLDKKKAREYLKKASTAGHAKAAFNLAQIIVSEKPDFAGFKEALPLYELAANSELADAQYALASIYATGTGVVTQDFPKARHWMERAAIGGLVSAQVELGIWMANGKGGPQNEEAALAWLKRAAARGNPIAFNRLAKMYLYGIGAKSDRVVAASFHVLAKRLGKRDAELENMFADLESIDQKRAIELANRWRKQ